jgi:flagellar protein FlaF
MGFSVSGATALLFVALLISFGTFYTATMGAVERVQEAEVDTQEQNIETLNTEIEVDSAVYNTTRGELTITANNTGAQALQPTELSLLVNGTFTGFDSANVTLSNPSGDALWVPQQTLTLTFNDDDPDLPEFNEGDTVKLVTATEVADTVTITEVSA